MSVWQRFTYTAAGCLAGYAAHEIYDVARDQQPAPCIVLLRLQGPIGEGLGARISAHRSTEMLNRAFRVKDARAVAIEINSPGGSPSQSSLIHNRIKLLREKHPTIPVVAFCTDVCASGGYSIACAAEDIYCLPSSIVGSIGVVAPGFGVVDLCDKVGIEDRTMASSLSKIGDHPMRPLDPGTLAAKRALLDDLHADFTNQVTVSRGGRLDHGAAAAYAERIGAPLPSGAALFDGAVYSGARAVKFGLADALYDDMHATLLDRFGPDLKVREIKRAVTFADRLDALTDQAGLQANANNAPADANALAAQTLLNLLTTGRGLP